MPAGVVGRIFAAVDMDVRARYRLIQWSPLMRVVALVMAFNVFMLPQVLTAQSIVNLYEECDSQPPPIIEEEVLKGSMKN